MLPRASVITTAVSLHQTILLKSDQAPSPAEPAFTAPHLLFSESFKPSPFSMSRRPNSVPLARWYSFPGNLLSRAFITPHIKRLWAFADPEYLNMTHRLITHVHTEGFSYEWAYPQQSPTCVEVRLTRQGQEALHLREGDLLNFENKAFARLDSLGQPYWRRQRTWEIDNQPMPPTSNFLLSYLKFSFLDAETLAEGERARAHLLTPVATHFFDRPETRHLPFTK